MVRAAALVFGFMISASAFAADRTEPYALSARAKTDIIRQVKDTLIDGESARWRWPLHQPEWGVYCGFVNSKNRMGAYVGFVPFFVAGGIGDGPKSSGEFKLFEHRIATPDGSDFDSQIVYKMCGKYGYSVSKVPPE